MNEHHCADAPLDHVRFHESDTSRRIRTIVRGVDRDNAYIGVRSTGKQCAVALVVDRPDPEKILDGSLLERAIRVRPEWLAAAAFVQANGWTATSEVLA